MDENNSAASSCDRKKELTRASGIDSSMVRVINGSIESDGDGTSSSENWQIPNVPSTLSGHFNFFGVNIPKTFSLVAALLLFFWCGFKGLLIGVMAAWLYGKYSGSVENGSTRFPSSSSSRARSGGNNIKTISDLPKPLPSGG